VYLVESFKTGTSYAVKALKKEETIHPEKLRAKVI